MANDRVALWGKWRTPVQTWVLIPTVFFLVQLAGLAQDAAALYRQNCAACHSIGGGPRVGPDLKDISARRDRAWLVRFVENAKAVVDSGDPYARDLVAKSHGMVMPPMKALDDAKTSALLDYIEAQSKPGQPVASAAKTANERPFTAADAARGKEIFLGSHPLAAGGAPCISCHTLHDLPGLGGGRLGPDLTRSYERLGGAGSMKGWLASPPTPTMQAAYRAHAFTPGEINALVAYFESAAKQDAANAAPKHPKPLLTALLIGLGGSLVGLVLLDEFWRKRFRAVRRPLVANGKGSR